MMKKYHSISNVTSNWNNKEQRRLAALRSETSRPLTWKEASSLMRCLRWKPFIASFHGHPVLMANRWGKNQRIASASSLRTMTPAPFWQRLRTIDPYRVAEVERNIW